MREILPLIIAHRGVSGHFPENTMVAFEASEKVGADMIELDTTLSKDNIPVVIHDDILNRTTNGNGQVRNFTFKELRDLDAGSWFGEKYKNEKIPSLEEVCEFVRESKLKVNIEIKSSSFDQEETTSGIESQVLKLIYGYGIEERCIISSFHKGIIERIRKKDNDIRISLLEEKIENLDFAIEFGKNKNVYSINLAKEFIPGEEFSKIKENFRVFAYTVNQKEYMIKMIENNVDAIFTDYPEEFKILRNSIGK